MSSTEFYNKTIEIFNKHNVEYMIVGGYAVIAHGYIRSTLDLDIWVKKNELNSEKIRKALEELGYQKDKCFQVKSIVRDGGMVKIFKENNKIDLMATYSTYLDFDDSYKKRKEIEVDNTKFVFIGFEELIESKIRSGRMKDYDDVKNLKDIDSFPNRKDQ